MNRDLKFFIGGIEDGCIAALKVAAGKYAGDITAYGGELDKKDLKTALAELALRFPLFLVSYVEGDDTHENPISPAPGAPWVVRHDCSFIVILVDDNARGEEERRRGAGGIYRMLSDTDEALSHRQFAVVIEGETVILNPGEFIPVGIEHLAHLPDQTAYARTFSAYFKYLTPDRRDEEKAIQTIEFGIDLTAASRRTEGNLPGVNLTVKE